MIDKIKFENKVREKVINYLRTFSKTEVLQYIETDEAKKEIKLGYEDCYDKIKSGEITDEIAMEDGTTSVAYCLSMMF